MLRKLTFTIMMLFAISLTAQTNLPADKGGVWKASDGKHINCHGGAILKAPDGVYYWYGEHRGDHAPQEGVACYTSTDLKNWENRGIVMQVSDEPGAVIERGSTIERPKVIYNPKTGKYVMWFHHELKGQGYAAAHSAVATADNPLGPFTPIKSSRIN
ncbi:MAG: beta-glucanase, partial [Muribaculaceae bacterium]|nr:beta-glucanase [Muribaculaceae bacterium]